MKLKEYWNSLTKVQALRCVKIVLGVECFQNEIWVFVLHECNETLVTDICKMEDLFFLTILLSQISKSCEKIRDFFNKNLFK